MSLITSSTPAAVSRFVGLFLLFAFTGLLFAACSDTAGTATPGTPAASPTDAYKQLYAAVKSKNTDAIKSTMSKKTQEFATMVAQRQNSPIEKVFENGFTATTFAERLPEIRDERVAGDMGNIEVFNSKDNRWEDLPFILEDGSWKLAVGDLFAGTHKSAGIGRARKEAEAANVLSNNLAEGSNTNANNSNAVIPAVPANANNGNTQ